MPTEGQDDIVRSGSHIVGIRGDIFRSKRIDIIALLTVSIAQVDNNKAVAIARTRADYMRRTDGSVFGIGAHTIQW